MSGFRLIVSGTRVVDGSHPEWTGQLLTDLFEFEGGWESVSSGLELSEHWRGWMRQAGTEESVAAVAVRRTTGDIDIAGGEIAVDPLTRSLLALVERGRDVVDALGAMVCRFEPDTRLTFVNSAYAKVFGQRSTLLGRRWLDFVPESERDELRENIASLTPEAPSRQYDQPVVTARGDTEWQEWTDRGLFDAAGRCVAVQSVGRDITERKETELALSAARRDAEASTQEQGEFLARLSHQMRTPIHRLQGLVSLLQRSVLDPQQQEHITRVVLELGDLGALLDDMQMVSQWDGLRVDARPFRLARMMEQAADKYRTAARARGITLNTLIAPGTPSWVVGDSIRISHALANYLSNAVKFTPAGGNVSVYCAPCAPAGREAAPNVIWLRFRVLDNGPGVPLHSQSRLFEAFQGVEGDGQGVGLAVVQSTVRLLGGRCGYSDARPRGAAFWFEVPVSEYQPAGGGPELDVADDAHRVLVVEDDEISRMVLERQLARYGCVVQSVADGTSALAALRSGRYELVFLDYRLPDMSGAELVSELRGLPDGRHVPVIGLTAHVLPSIAHQCIEAGMDDCLSKPLTSEILESTLRRFLGRTSVR